MPNLRQPGSFEKRSRSSVAFATTGQKKLVKRAFSRANTLAT